MNGIDQLIAGLRGGCIVSCQALAHEPLYGSAMMAAMAAASEQGGAVGIRANTPQDIQAIKERCALPVIGLFKRDYPGSEVFITPTWREAAQVIEAGADFVALDATARPRPGGVTLTALVREIRSHYPGTGIVADVSTYEEGIAAMELGADLICTTLSGYTSYSLKQEGPDIGLVARLSELGTIPVVAEGRIWTIEDSQACMRAGAHAVVIGTAITRPQEITKRYVKALNNG